MKEFMTLKGHMKASIRLKNPFEWSIILRLFFYSVLELDQQHSLRHISTDKSRLTSLYSINTQKQIKKSP